MTILVAIILCEATFLLALILWNVVSILLGGLAAPLGMAFYLSLLAGAVVSVLFVTWRRQKKNLTRWSLMLWALVLTFPAMLTLLLDTTRTEGWVLFVYLYLAMLFAVVSIRSILARLSLERREEIAPLIIRFIRMVGLVILVAVILLPFYFMLFSSVTPRAFFLKNPLNLIPRFEIGIGNLLRAYGEVMTTYRFGRYILNSLIVSISTVIVTLIPATLGAYAVTRLRFRGRDLLSRSILLIYMFPTIVLAIPLYSVFASLGLRDTLLGLLIVYPAVTIPVSLYMLRNYFQTLPKDIEEAGIIDGCSRLGVIWRITLPLSLPALLAVGLYIFMIAWNEFLFAFMFLDKQAIFTLSRGVVSLDSQEVPRQFLMAGAIIITVPVMCIFFAFERFFTGGLSAGGVKE